MARSSRSNRRKRRNRIKRRNLDNRHFSNQTPIVVAMGFLLCLFFFILVNLVVPSRAFSNQENRILAQRPTLAMDDVVSGVYMAQYEDFLSDQFTGRNVFRFISTSLRRLGGSRMENDVFIGRGNQLLENIVTPNPEDLSANIESIQDFTIRYPQINHYIMIVPDAANILSDSLPFLATVADQTRQINHVRAQLDDYALWIDVSSALNQHSAERIFYQTDHHWTSLGAFVAFQEAAGIMEIEGDMASAFAAFPVATNFNGALAARSGVGLNTLDDIFIYVPREESREVIVNYIYEQRRTTSLFDLARLETRDKHSVFLGEASPLISVRTTSPYTRRLLVVRDSFANNFVQFLTPFFREIVLVNPKYYPGSIDEIMRTYRITDSLILYSGNTFFGDQYLREALAEEELD